MEFGSPTDIGVTAALAFYVVKQSFILVKSFAVKKSGNGNTHAVEKLEDTRWEGLGVTLTKIDTTLTTFNNNSQEQAKLISETFKEVVESRRDLNRHRTETTENRKLIIEKIKE